MLPCRRAEHRRVCVGPVVGALFLALAACADDSERADDPNDSGIPLPTGDDTAGDDGIGDVDDGGEKLDLSGGDGGSGNAGDEGGEEGCEKVDFLFVIDSSRSMQDEQVNLLSSFPGFITAIQDTLMFNDFNLMVVDAGLILGQDCNGVLGAGRVTSADGNDCMLMGGQRYATQSTPDLTAAFQCMASRGYMGPGNEQTMDALLASIGPLTAPGQCNEGFLRDDAILVVTIITDEEDSPSDGSPNPPLDGSCEAADADPNSLGDPAAWKQALVAAKNGDENAIVVLSLIGDCDTGGECEGILLSNPLDPLSPVSGAEPAPRLRMFTESFVYGSLGPVCAPDYTPFFTEAVSVIESACDDFVPPG